ncbi:hypothetical protein AAGG74_15170 [Bacillus mexicanus]|uniref:hypothetical protein n=1 Tax=Bacillus mexicanus TaxID=2834415 RepID=UPI003D1A86F0
MKFEVIDKKDKVFCGDLADCIRHMKGLGSPLALDVENTGLDFSLMKLIKGKMLTLEDKDEIEIRVTRIL